MDPNIRHEQARLERLRGAFNGQRCFLMGNGPSLNEMDLELFASEQVWGSNRCHLLFDRISWRPSHYVAVDRRVVSDIADEVTDLIRDLPSTTFFFPEVFRIRRLLPSEPQVYWFRELELEETDRPWDWFSPDAARAVRRTRTVTVSMLQLAVHLGFDPIYLIGCDTRYEVPETARSEGGSEGDTTPLRSTQDDDPNHFDPRYFGRGRAWHEPNVEGMLLNYQRAKEACDELDVAVYNATVGGDLEIFPRVDYRELF